MVKLISKIDGNSIGGYEKYKKSVEVSEVEPLLFYPSDSKRIEMFGEYIEQELH